MDDTTGTDLFDRLFARCVEERLSPEQAALPDHPDLVAALEKGLKQYRASAVVEGENSPPAGGVPKRFIDLERVDEGGMGIVYKARDLELDRLVAYKVMSASFALQEGKEGAEDRFYHEARLTSRLKHPGIVPVHALVADANGMPAYAMELIDGEPLSKVIARFHQRDWRAAGADLWRTNLHLLLRRLIAACNIIHHAHTGSEESAFIHGDLKPSNVMVGQGPDATWVIDWGIAREVRRADAQPEEPTRLMTPAWAGPSALRGEPATEASDVYSLGMILDCILVPPPESVGKARPVPKALAAVRDKALSPERERRYESAAALAADLMRYLEDDAVTAYGDPVWTRLRRWWRRWPRLASALLLATVLLPLVSVLAWEVRANRERLKESEYQNNFLEATLQMNMAGLKLRASQDAAGAEANLRDAANRLERLHAEKPGETACQMALVQCYCNLAGLAGGYRYGSDPMQPRKPSTLRNGLVWCEKIEPHVPFLLAQTNQGDKIAPDCLMVYWATKVGGLNELKRHTEALLVIDEALKTFPTAQHFHLARDANLLGAAAEQADLPWSGKAKGSTADHARATRSAAYLVTGLEPHLAGKRGDLAQTVARKAVYNAACAFALAAAAQPPGPERDRLASEAMKYLQRIAKVGYFRGDQQRRELRTDIDLDSLRSRADFRALVTESERP